MVDFLQRLKQRKLVQWMLAYLAAAWVVLQVLDLAAGSYHWPDTVMHIAFAVLSLGFVVALVLAWYHGERGAQRATGAELLLIALVLAVGGGLLWHFGRIGSSPAATKGAATTGASPPALVASGSGPPVAAPSTAAASLLMVEPIAAQPIPAKSVAVLPFENLSTDKGNAYFADGMQDLILTKLADIGDLKVISRTSTMKYASHPDDLKTIGQQLGVATILEGSVQKAGNQVLINVQLIDAKTDSHIWAQSYTRTLTNIFGVEGEVAGKVAASLNAKLTTEETAAVARIPTTNPQAYTLYLKAQRNSDQAFTVYGDKQLALSVASANDLRQAVALDPKFAAAYANLAFAELGLANSGKGATKQLVMAHAKKALALQPDLAIAHLVVGILLEENGEFTQGLQEVRTAARLAPNNANVAYVLSGFYEQMGELKQAYDVAHKAVSIDPRNGVNYSTAAYYSGALRRYADARQLLERGLAVDPSNVRLQSSLGDLMEILGDPAGARVRYAKLPADFLGIGRYTELAYAWVLSRNCAKALDVARQMPPVSAEYLWRTGQREELIGRCELDLGREAQAKSALDQGRTAILAALKQHPKYGTPELYATLALIGAWSDNRDASIAAADNYIALRVKEYKRERPPGSSVTPMQYATGAYERKAKVLAHFGDAKGATDILGQLFDSEGTGWDISVPLLELDPVWDPIRHDPRFQALLKKYSRPVPASANSAATASIAGTGSGDD